jgi:peptide/nickel transport system permease protein
MPTTLTLTFGAMLLALLIAVPVGIYGAVRRNSMVDHVATLGVFLGQSMPVFWTGIMLILLFSVQWRFLPVSGWDSRRRSCRRRRCRSSAWGLAASTRRGGR